MYGVHGRYLRIDLPSGRAEAVPLDEGDAPCLPRRGRAGGVARRPRDAGRARPARARGGPGVRVQPARREPAHDLGQVRGGRLQPAHRTVLRRAVVVAFRPGGQAHRVRCPGDQGQAHGPSVVFVDGTGDGDRAWSIEPAGELRGLPARGRGADPSRGTARLAGRGDRPGGRAAHPVRLDQPRRPPRRPRRARGGARVEAGQGAGRAGRPPRAAGRPGARPWEWPRTSRSARSARPPRSTASSAPWPTCSCSTASIRCRPATFRRATSRASSAGGRGPRPRAPGREELVRIVHDRLRTCLRREARGGNRHATCACGWNMRACSRSARCAGSNDPEAVLRAADACDAYGLDTISTGGTIAFLMECVERGWIDGRLPGSGRSSGSATALRWSRRSTCCRTPGRDRHPARVGQPSGGREDRRRRPWRRPSGQRAGASGLSPGTLPAMALGLAVGTRGADHNRSGAYEADFSERLDPDPDRPRSPAPRSRPRIAPRCWTSLILCKFLRGVFRDLHAETAPMLAAVTGWDVSVDELRTVARRVVKARKCLNIREGWTRAEDTLPARLFEAPSDLSPRPRLTRDRLDAQVDAYYPARGWTAEGLVPLLCRAGARRPGVRARESWVRAQPAHLIDKKSR